jgi:hypothetical protein
LKELGKDVVKDRAKEILDKNLEDLADAQELLYADDRYAVLIVLQAMDAAGRDGTIKHVMSGVNPQGCQVFNFKKSSAEELNHNFFQAGEFSGRRGAAFDLAALVIAAWSAARLSAPRCARPGLQVGEQLPEVVAVPERVEIGVGPHRRRMAVTQGHRLLEKFHGPLGMVRLQARTLGGRERV